MTTSAGASRKLAPVLWIGPAALVLLAVFAYSLVQVLTTSLRYKGEWVGWENFELVVTDPLFLTAITHNALLLLCVPVLLALAVAIAVVLFESRRGQRFFRGVVFFPYILPVTVVGILMGQLLQLNGAVNTTLRAIGLDGVAQDWLGDPTRALWTMAAIIIWKEVGFGVILVYSTMLSLSPEVYEAARVDGAGFWRLHRSITLPQLVPILTFYAVTEAIVMVSWVFNYVYVLTNGQGGPGDATMIAELYIYRTAFPNSAPELAAAASLLLFAATLILIVAFFVIQKRSLRQQLGEG
ncbi:MAG: carbohydrate ABC transporter permease [Beutenbergiaceae bacterium]